jgi:Domain of unknown function (DUF4410)
MLLEKILMKTSNSFIKTFVLLVAFSLFAIAQDNKKPLAGYTTIVVEKFTVEKTTATEGFPAGEEGVLQKTAISKMRQKQAFATIIDGSESAAGTEEASKRLILSGTIIGFDKGSRAKRYAIGFGAGSTKLKVRLVIRDADNQKELLSVDREGKFRGMFTLVGGNQAQAMSDVANDVIDGLIKEINKNR